jgi:tetratricopeptide (TPR) repeat protein
MPNHHFISFSRIEARDFALRLSDDLAIGEPPTVAWIDLRDVPSGVDWDDAISEAIKTCETLIFIMTPDSVRPNSNCKNEWAWALRYKKAVVPLLLDPSAEAPFRLHSRQHIDCTGDYRTALAGVRSHLRWRASPEGVLQTLRERLADAERDLPRAKNSTERSRIESDLADLKRQVADQQQLVEHPQKVAQRVDESIARGMERERQPAQPVSGFTRTRFINPPPGVAPFYFQDRHVETRLVGDFLKTGPERMITVVGRGGVGKTAIVCRLLKALERGQLPDDGGELAVNGIVYLSATGSRRLTVANLFADLGALLPEDREARLDALYRDPQVKTEARVRALMAEFPAGQRPTVLLLDNFEDVVCAETFQMTDAELSEALHAVLEAPSHSVKIVITTRVVPRDLALVKPGHQLRLDLDEGLPSPYAENILREMDAAGKVGLKNAPAPLLLDARERTRGYPRALEALFAILSADRDTSLEELLKDTARMLPENVVKELVGEAFCRLDPTAQRVIQALAIYGRPVTPAAVDYLLQPFLAGVNSAPILGRLVHMQFVRKESGRYYLHPVDLAFALSRVDPGNEFDHRFDPLPFTQIALRHRAADYFQLTRSPRETWKKLDDLAPQLAEFELRCAAHDFDTAAAVLLEIDFDYLLLWGHFRLMAELHERLRGRLDDWELEQDSVGNLGSAYYSMGRIGEAIQCQEQALAIARRFGDRSGEAVNLSRLANRFSVLGQTQHAIELHERALAIACEVGDRTIEGHSLGSLASCYSDLGQTQRAIELYEQALTIARDIADRYGEGSQLGNLAGCYSDLGQTLRAIELYEQALAIAREIGARSCEGYWLHNLSDSLTVELQSTRAVEYAVAAVSISAQIQEPRLGSYSGGSLARAHLLAGDLARARAAVEAARLCDTPENNFYVCALGGVIALRQGDRPAAEEMLAAAVAEAHRMLQASSENYQALDSRALALCGMALSEGSARATEAVEAYHSARRINRDAGVVKRVLLLFDALAVLDKDGALAGVRSAAAGEA